MSRIAEGTRFIADSMLGSLARKLRALGFDASYFRSGEDILLVRQALDEGRIILTSDRALASAAPSRGVTAFLLEGRSDGARAASIARNALRANIKLFRGPPRCSICNGALKTVGRNEAFGRVPARIAESHRRFYLCASCDKLYWHGSHWKKLRSVAVRLNLKPVVPHT